MKSSVLLVGRYPPPVGGNTIHIQRLASKLAQQSCLVAVADLYSRQFIEHYPPRQSEPLGIVAFLRLVALMASNAVAHFHISAGTKFYLTAPLLLALTCRARKRVLTIHSGGWAAEFRLLAGIKRALAVRVLSRFDDIICVNEVQAETLRPIVPSRLHVIPAFLPEDTLEAVVVPEALRIFTHQVDVLLVTSGYGTPTYDYETVIRGVELAQSATADRLGLVIASYSTWDMPYWNHVTEAYRGSSVAVMATNDLSPNQFISLLHKASIYVRATTHDGDAVAIREAAAAGAQVVASDSAPRPHAAAMFATGDALSLANALRNALDDPSYGRLPEDVYADVYSAINRVYEI